MGRGYWIGELNLVWIGQGGGVYGCKRGLLEKYPTFGREKETGLLGALDT